MYYSDELIEEVRTRNPIVDVIGSYVHLQKKGANYFGLCPFHNEKSPSFSVSPQKQMYHCFGCGVGGNVITFVMEYENYSFQEAMKMLADRAGITLPQQEYTKEMRREQDTRSQLLAVHKDAATFYYKLLRSEQGKTGLSYLRRRGVSDDMIRTFGLGYAGTHPSALYQYLHEKDYPDSLLRDSGLFRFSEKGVSDRFWNRVMFPIMDQNSRVIAFGGRVMGDGEPKYLNSPETKIFDKSRNLYGLNLARKARKGNFLVCEGYMDVIAMHQAGFNNAVASLGTAFTVQHGMIMKRYTDEVILCYDNDGAGRKAALRAIPILKEAGLRVKVLTMEPYKDPDEFIKNLGAEEFQKRIDQAKNAFLFEISVLRQDYDFNDPDDKSRFFNSAAERLAEFTDEIERNSYTEAIAGTYGIDYQVLRGKVNLIGNSRTGTPPREAPKDPERARSRRERDSGIQAAEKLVLTVLSEKPEFSEGISLQPEDFSDPLMKELSEILLFSARNGAVNPGAILNRYIDSENYSEVAALMSSRYTDTLPREELSRAFSEAVRRIRRESIDRRMAAATSPQELMELMKEKQKLS